MSDHRPRRESYWRRILGQTFVRWGARLGLVWVGLLAFLGVFSPFLASSFPLLLSRDGEISSPVLRYLQPVDTLFLVAFLAVVALYFLRMNLRRNW
jgi:peptide/nickel transport system permease protein